LVEVHGWFWINWSEVSSGGWLPAFGAGRRR
jgi:hypothetical protein